MGIIWTIIVGVIVGTIAKFIMPGGNEPRGFIITAILGIVGSFLASYAGQALGWYAAGQSAVRWKGRGSADQHLHSLERTVPPSTAASLFPAGDRSYASRS